MKNLTLIALALLAISGCKNRAAADSQAVKPVVAATVGTVIEITSEEQFKQAIARKNRLMVIDLYADWCGPCKQLAPILRDVAKTHGESADFFKVNSDNLPQIAKLFPTQGIPHVVFFKDSSVINTLTGLYPKSAYEQGVEILSQPFPETADGTIKNGLRQIKLDGSISKRNISTFKGDKVELTFKSTGKPFTAEGLKATGSSDGKSDLVLQFDTKELGAFPLTLTDESGRKDRLWILVSQYEAAQGGYREVSASEFAKSVSEPNTIILDVRTAGEFAEGHIKGATLIPVQELQERLAELESAKNKTVLVYCRSGHRSTVASKILNEAGFRSVVNLNGGISAWKSASLEVVQ